MKKNFQWREPIFTFFSYNIKTILFLTARRERTEGPPDALEHESFKSGCQAR